MHYLIKTLYVTKLKNILVNSQKNHMSMNLSYFEVKIDAVALEKNNTVEVEGYILKLIKYFKVNGF